MQAAGGLGGDGAGYLGSANYAGYLVGAFLVALLPQRWTLLVLRLCLIASVATTAAMAATTLIWAWAVLRAAAGLVSAGVLILPPDIVFRRLSPERREAPKALPFAAPRPPLPIPALL